MKVTFKNVTKKFGNVTAVSNFSTEITSGKLICLLGPSGCGKSTLLNMLCGIYPVTEGQIFFDEKDVTDLPIDLRNVGMVFQNYALYPHMTVLDNICFPLEVQKMPKKERQQKAMEIAKLVHIDTLLKRYPRELSGGQQQRVAIARALVKSPNLLLMDEPLSNLDARLRIEMREEISRIQKETKVTTIFVTHDQEEALSISDEIFLMKNGVLVQKGIAQNLYKQPENRFVAEFMGNPPINQIEGKDFPETVQKLWELNGKALEKETYKNSVLDIRAESIEILNEKSSEITVSAQVSKIYEMGKERFAYLTITENNRTLQIRSILGVDEQVEEGKTISIVLKKSGVFLFNAQNGERL